MRANCTLFAFAGVLAAAVASQNGKPIVADVNKYRTWALVNPKPMQLSKSMTLLCVGPDMNPKGDDGPHISRYIRVYVNPAGKIAMASGKPFPIGTAIVKEKTRGKSGPVELSTFIVKREKGFNPKCGDWEFGVIDGPTRKIVEKGKINRCMKCHVEKRDLDFTFRSYLPGKG